MVRQHRAQHGCQSKHTNNGLPVAGLEPDVSHRKTSDSALLSVNVDPSACASPACPVGSQGGGMGPSDMATVQTGRGRGLGCYGHHWSFHLKGSAQGPSWGPFWGPSRDYLRNCFRDHLGDHPGSISRTISGTVSGIILGLSQGPPQGPPHLHHTAPSCSGTTVLARRPQQPLRQQLGGGWSPSHEGEPPGAGTSLGPFFMLSVVCKLFFFI